MANFRPRNDFKNNGAVMTVPEAQEFLKEKQSFGKIVAGGRHFVVFRGQEEGNPSKWEELGRIAIENGCVPVAALRLVGGYENLHNNAKSRALK